MADLMQQAQELAKACEERAEWGRGSRWNLPRDSAGTSRLLDEVASLLRETAAALRAAPVPRVNIECETSDGYIIGTTSLPVIRVELEDDGSYTAVTDYWPPASDVHDATRAARPQGVRDV